MSRHANSERLRRTRCALARSQAELARAAGVSQPNIAAFETGKRTLSDGMLRRLLVALDARPSVILRAHRDEVVNVAERFGASNLRLFGSSARGEDTVDSDIDLVVTWNPEASLWDFANFEIEMEELLGVRVNTVPEDGLTDRHSDILRDAVPL